MGKNLLVTLMKNKTTDNKLADVVTVIEFTGYKE